MWLYAARRLLMIVPIALGVTIICFGLLYLAPGDPIQSLLPPGATDQDAAMMRKLYGLDKPVPVQYVVWLGRALTGDLGNSISTKMPVTGEVGRALGNTIVIAVV